MEFKNHASFDSFSDDDFSQLAELFNEFNGDHESPLDVRDEQRLAFENEHNRGILTASEGKTMLGLAAYHYERALGAISVDLLTVRENFQRSSLRVGSELLSETEKEGIKFGAKMAELEPVASAVHFYKKQGYASDYIVPDFMRKALDPNNSPSEWFSRKMK